MKPLTIDRLTAAEGRSVRSDLVTLLQDAVHGGASIGFLSPLETSRAENYWEHVFDEIDDGSRVLLVARDGNRSQASETYGSTIHGTVQLALATKQNALHRAEVQKLFVHTRYRCRGIGNALLTAVENVARELGRHVLILDTETDSPAQRLYERHGYTRLGEIPQWALSPHGNLHGAMFYYRLLQ